jgi:endonuclease YncB( thermonuclease family)
MPLAALVGAGGIAVILTSEPLSGTPGVGDDAIVGRASVVDGDTLQIQGMRIRLHGIDAPESDQSCTVREAPVACGRLATTALAYKIDGHSVACEPKTRDRYAWMVSHGWAMVYRQYSWDYLPEEIAARWHAVGIWEGVFAAPWDWRHQQQH